MGYLTSQLSLTNGFLHLLYIFVVMAVTYIIHSFSGLDLSIILIISIVHVFPSSE